MLKFNLVKGIYFYEYDNVFLIKCLNLNFLGIFEIKLLLECGIIIEVFVCLEFGFWWVRM